MSLVQLGPPSMDSPSYLMQFKTLMTNFRWALYPSAVSPLMIVEVCWFCSVSQVFWYVDFFKSKSRHCWIISLSSNSNVLSFSLGFDIWICWMSAEVYDRTIVRGLSHAKITAAAITTASSVDSRIHSMKLYGCEMTARVIFNLLYITWAEHSSIYLPLLLSVSSTAMFNSVLKPLKFLSSFNLPTVSFH